MTPDMPVTLVREGLLLLVSVGGPIFGAILVLGFILGVLQAATQINDPAVTFLPRAAGAILICATLGGWIVERMANFFMRAMTVMSSRPF